MQFFKTCFFLFFFFFLSSRRVRFESVTALKYGTWFLDEQDTRQNTELKKSVVHSVSLCLSWSFLVYFDKQTHKKLKKKNSASKKDSNLGFCWMKCAPKNKCVWQLWDTGFIFLALTHVQSLWNLKHVHEFVILRLTKMYMKEVNITNVKHANDISAIFCPENHTIYRSLFTYSSLPQCDTANFLCIQVSSFS